MAHIPHVRGTRSHQPVFNDFIKYNVTEEFVIAVHAILLFHDPAVTFQHIRVRPGHLPGKGMVLLRELWRTYILVSGQHDLFQHIVWHHIAAAG